MTEFTRFRINFGPHVTFDENTVFSINGELEDIENWSTQILSIPQNRQLKVKGISVFVPNDASKVVIMNNINGINMAIYFFLKQDDTLVDNPFAYAMCLENWISLNVT